MMANTAFVFLPALVGWSATKRFGGSEVLGIVMGLLLVHPDLLNAWGYGTAALEGDVPTFNILGLFEIEKVGYQGQILPILAAAFILSHIEIFLKKTRPERDPVARRSDYDHRRDWILALSIVGPLTRGLGNVIATGIVNIFEAVPVVGALLFGLLYAPLVVTGMHICSSHRLAVDCGDEWDVPLADARVIEYRTRGAALAMFYVFKRDPKQKEHGLDVFDFRILRNYGTGHVRCQLAKQVHVLFGIWSAQPLQPSSSR